MVEGEPEQGAEAADHLVHVPELACDGVGGADYPEVVHEVFERDVLVGDVFGVLHVVDEGVCAEGEEWVEVVAPCPAEHAVERAFAGFFVGVGYPDVADDAPFAAAWRSLARSCRALFDCVPVAGDIDGVEAEAHGDVAALADNLEGLGVGACACDADGRVRLLEGSQEGSEVGVLVLGGIGDVDVPELAFVVEAAVDVTPDAEDDFERLAGAGVMLAFLEVDIEELMVGEETARTDAEHVSALREVVEVCDAVGKLDGIVEREEVRAGAELDVLRAQEGLRDEQVGRGNGLPGRGEVLADPCLAEAEVVGEFQAFEVPLVGVPGGALGRVRGHQEQTGFHGGSPIYLRAFASGLFGSICWWRDYIGWAGACPSAAWFGRLATNGVCDFRCVDAAQERTIIFTFYDTFPACPRPQNIPEPSL